MKIGEILRNNQEDVYKKLNSRPKKKKRRRGRNTNKSLSFSDIENLMKHDSYCRGPGGAIRQKTWSNK